MSDTELIALVLVGIGTDTPIDAKRAEEIVVNRPDIFCGYNANDNFHIDWDMVAALVNEQDEEEHVSV